MTPKDPAEFTPVWNGSTTIEYCVEVCRGMNKEFALLHGIDCFCEESLENLARAPARECGTACGGNPNQECGGLIRGALSVYEVGPSNACEYEM